MIYTTLNRIRAHRPCEDGWEKLLHGLGKTSADDEPLSFEKIVELNGISDALWCARAEPQHAQFWRLYAVWCARRVVHLATNPASSAVLLYVAERHALGQVNAQELDAARADYWAAATYTTAKAASGADYAVYLAAAQAAKAPTWAAQAANDAYWAATYAAKAATYAAKAAYYAAEAAHAAEQEAQTEEFLNRLRNHKEEMP